MRAIHINSTAPFFASNPDKEYRIDDFEILCTMLSALKWREKNGSIMMITDSIGANYYKSLGLESIWDDGIDSSLGKGDPAIDDTGFWAAGKIFALKRVKAPVAMIDTDFIVWDNISDILGQGGITAAHREELYNDVYPHPSTFKTGESSKKAFWLDGDYADILPCNTAFAYFHDNEFKEFYVQQSIAFMTDTPICDDTLTYMVFAEQRLLAMCAAKMGVEITTLLDKDKLFETGGRYTHLWGYKQQLRENENERQLLCERLEYRIKKDFPQYEQVLMNVKNELENNKVASY